MAHHMVDSGKADMAIELAIGLECWKVGLSHGSVLHFELGEKLLRRDRDGRDEAVGEGTLWLESDDWKIIRDAVEISDSATVDREVAELKIAEAFLGKRFTSLRLSRGSAEVRFGDSLRIEAWRADDGNMAPEDDLVELFLPDGRIVYCTERGIFISDDTDALRAAHWAAKHNS